MATFTCPVCTKTVYFAERQMREGKAYHPACLQRFLKDSAKGSHASHPFQSFTDAPTVPAPAVQKSGTGAPSQAAPAGGAKFCGNCGAASSGGKFCGSCGKPVA